MSKRIICQHCYYPSVTCVCDAVKPCSNQRNIILLRSKAESKNAKNTGRLLQLSLRNMKLVNSDDADEMKALEMMLISEPKHHALFFPSQCSQPFEEAISNSKIIQPTHRFIFIDSTWRKAKRLLLENTWLQEIPQYHFQESVEGQYRIRKTNVDNGLSTLESVAYALEKADSLDTSTLHTLFAKMQSFWPQNPSSKNES